MNNPLNRQPDTFQKVTPDWQTVAVPPGATPPTLPNKPRRPRWQLVTAAVAVLLLGLVIGIASSQGAKRDLKSANQHITTLDSVLAASRTSNASLKQSNDSLQQAKTTLQQKNDTMVGKVAQYKATASSALKSARTTATAEFKTRQAGLDARARQLHATKNSLDRRARAVSGMEHSWAANTIPGDGIFAVGSDIAPGLYKADSSPSGSCYYARLSSLGGDGFDNIIDNNNVSGPLTISVASSDAALELSGCADFHKIG